MMKEGTVKRINSLVINYLSIIGLWGDGQANRANQDNPVVLYFMTNIMMTNPISVLSDNNPIVMEKTLIGDNNFLTTDIPVSFFHVLVKELYNIYEKLDDINNHQNQEVRELLIRFVGNEFNFKEYINAIMRQYKDSFYELVTHYNSPNPEYNSIRLKILSDKLSECVKEEDYLTAAKVRDKINIIKEKGK
jgi:hypothetical protein